MGWQFNSASFQNRFINCYIFLWKLSKFIIFFTFILQWNQYRVWGYCCYNVHMADCTHNSILLQVMQILLSFLWHGESTPEMHIAMVLPSTEWFFMGKYVGTTQKFLQSEQQTKYFSSIGMRDGAWRVLDSNQIISLLMPNARHAKRVPQLKTFQSTQNPLSLPLWMHYYFVEWVQRDLWLTSCLMTSIGYSISRTYNSLQKVRILHIPLLYWA